MTDAAAPVFVVTLRRRLDRRHRLQPELRREGISHVWFNTDLGVDVDAATFAPGTIAGLKLFPWRLVVTDNKWWRRDLKTGEIACSLAHLALWQRVAASKFPYAVVLEDDAALSSGFVDTLTATIHELEAHDPAWDFLYLGRRRWAGDTEIGCAGVVIPGYSACLHAYALTPDGARKLVAAGLERAMMPIDEFVPACISVHPRPDVARAVRPVLHGYACRTDLVHVLPKDVWGSDTEASSFVQPTDVRLSTASEV
jgi:glycosyl transferase, family 25